jgi:7,8-dihydroneopterin aldolase/epimerase/oxygenase
MLDTTPAPHHPETDPEQDEPGIYEIFLRDVVMPLRIGVYPPEYKAPQRVRIDLDLDVRQDRATLTDDIGDVVSYDDILNNLRRIAAGEHINLLEVLAERIAGLCLGDPRVLRVRVAVAKLDIYGGTGIPGIRIERRRKALRLPYEEV